MVNFGFEINGDATNAAGSSSAEALLNGANAWGPGATRECQTPVVSNAYNLPSVEIGTTSTAHGTVNAAPEAVNGISENPTPCGGSVQEALTTPIAQSSVAATQVGENAIPQTATSAPEVGLSGFDQNAPAASSNPLGKLWHGMTDALGAGQSLQDQITKKMVSQLTPEQRKEYNKETAEIRQRETAADINTNAPPLDLPMHNLVQSRVQQTERQIANQVQSQLSPNDLQELQSEWNQYSAPRPPVNPLGGPVGYPMPKPGPEINAYYQQIQTATEKYLQQNG
ncbi:MAG TPA: hypothetical protein V6C81_10605 [Planktothrix sp.]